MNRMIQTVPGIEEKFGKLNVEEYIEHYENFNNQEASLTKQRAGERYLKTEKALEISKFITSFLEKMIFG